MYVNLPHPSVDMKWHRSWPCGVKLSRVEDAKKRCRYIWPSYSVAGGHFFHNFSFIKKTEKFPSTFNGAHRERSRASTTRGNISILSGSAVYDGFDGVTHTSIHRHFAAQAFVKAAFRRIFSRRHHHYIIITWSASSHIVISLIMRRNENCEFDV